MGRVTHVVAYDPEDHDAPDVIKEERERERRERELKITLVSLLSHAHVVHTKSYLKSFIKPSQWNNLNILFTKFGSIVLLMNSGQN